MELTEDTLINYIKGELPDAERQVVESQLMTDEHLFKQYLQLKDIWDYAGYKNNTSNYQPTEEWNTLSQKASFMKVRKLTAKRVLGITSAAACMVIAFLLGQWWTNGISDDEMIANHVFTTPAGQISQITLADGSTVVLNAGSSLTVPSNFGEQNRDVQLTGEAHFTVTKNPDLTFMVKSGQQYVKVLGTIFNIRAYPGEEKIITTLEEGIVRWESNGRHITMQPDMQVVYDVTNQNIEQKDIDASRIGQWAVGRYVFENASFADVVDMIEKWYDVEIDWRRADFEGEHYNGVIKKSASLTETLELIRVMTPVIYEVKGQNVSIKRMR